MNRIKVNRTIEIAIALALVLVLAYLVSVSLKVSSGISRTVDSPGLQIRVQVLNGCGVRGTASKMADHLAGFTDEDIELVVVDTDNFDLTEISESFLISRVEDLKPARLLAQRLGLESDNIEYRPMANNYRHVSVTLVLGADYKTVSLNQSESEEQ